MKEILKLLIVLSGYVAIAPLAGWALARNRTAERLTLCLMLFMTSWFPTKLTLMVDSVEWYRGHTKGYEFSLLVGTGIALCVSAAVRRPPGFRAIPPGLWLYLLHCALSCLSFLPAANRSFGFMAAWKFTSAALVFAGAFHAFRDETDLRWVLRTLAGTLILQALVCLKMRLLDGRWQVHGWFEHQNPMAMWAYLCSLPLLGVALSPHVGRRDSLLLLGGVAAAALMILLSVSRAALAAFVLGSLTLTLLSYARGLSVRNVSITALGACAALAAGLVALDSLAARLQENATRDETEDLRSVLNRQSRAMLQDSAVGIGWNNFGLANSLPQEKYVQIMMEWDASRGFRIYEHNYQACPLTESLYWLLLAETGYPGFVSYIAFLALTVWWGARSFLRHGATLLGCFVAGVLIALLLTYLHGAVERILSQTKNLSLWLIFAGFLARIDLLRRVRPASPTTSPVSLA